MQDVEVYLLMFIQWFFILDTGTIASLKRQLLPSPAAAPTTKLATPAEPTVVVAEIWSGDSSCHILQKKKLFPQVALRRQHSVEEGKMS